MHKPDNTIPESTKIPRILVVEDERQISRFIELELRHEGYEVSIASNGIDALVFAREQQPDLMVLDLMLPGIDGLEVCRRLPTGTSNPGDHYIPIIDEINSGRDEFEPGSSRDDLPVMPGTAAPNQSNTSPVTRRLAPIIERLSGPGLFVQISSPSGEVLATSSNLGESHLPLPAIYPSSTSETKIERIPFPAGINLTEDLSYHDLN